MSHVSPSLAWKAVLLVLAGGASFVLPVAAPAAVLPATVVQDTYIESNNPNNLFANNRFVLLRVFSSVSRAGFIQFELPALPATEELVSAQLTLNSAESGANTSNVLLAGLSINPNLGTTSWNTAIANNIITGRDPSTFVVGWGSNATIFADEPMNVSAGTTGNQIVYTDSTINNGLLQYIDDHIGTSPVTVTLGFAFDVDVDNNAIWQFRSNNDNGAGGTVPTPPGPVTASLLLFTQTLAAPIPEPNTALLLSLGGVLLRRSRMKRREMARAA